MRYNESPECWLTYTMVLAKKRNLEPVKPLKAYRSTDFLNSGHARHIRILCEYEETMQRLHEGGPRLT